MVKTHPSRTAHNTGYTAAAFNPRSNRCYATTSYSPNTIYAMPDLAGPSMGTAFGGIRRGLLNN